MPLRVEVRVESDAFANKVFVAGYHGFGLVGYLTARHLVKALGGRKIGYVVSPYMPQVVNAGPEGLTTPYELYDVGLAVVFLPNVPLPQADLIRIPYKLAEASVAGGAKVALLVGGLDASYRKGGDTMRYAATRTFLARYDNLVKGLQQLEEGLSIVGPLAAMLAYYEAHDFPAVAVLPYADPSSIDPMAAKAAVEFISRVLQVEVDVSDLMRMAEEKARLEREFEELRKRMGRESRTPSVPTFYV
ncbi:MAG: PAC2 family protein [Thermofilaceae archaeon]